MVLKHIKKHEVKMREVAAKSREIQDYYYPVTMKSSRDISADSVRQGSPNYGLRVKSDAGSHFVKNEKITYL